MYQSNRSFNIPPGQPPRHLNFWKIFVQIPPSRDRKAVQMPHHRSIPSDQMPPPPGNFSVAFIILRKLCMETWFKTTLLHAKDNINGSWIPSNTEKSLCKPLLFSQSATNRYLLLWMHEGLSSPWFITPCGISATRNMKSRLAIKFPPNSSLWKRVIAWERSRAASGCGIIWGDADQNKQRGI